MGIRVLEPLAHHCTAQAQGLPVDLYRPIMEHNASDHMKPGWLTMPVQFIHAGRAGSGFGLLACIISPTDQGSRA